MGGEGHCFACWGCGVDHSSEPMWDISAWPQQGKIQAQVGPSRISAGGTFHQLPVHKAPSLSANSLSFSVALELLPLVLQFRVLDELMGRVPLWLIVCALGSPSDP